MRRFLTLLLLIPIVVGCSADYDPMAGTPPAPAQASSPEWLAYQDCVANRGRDKCTETTQAARP